MHNFKLVNADTDSISFCKPDGSAFSEQEREFLLNELNSLYPSKIHFEPDGYFLTLIVLRAKNYVMYDGQKIKIKGSALKDQKKEEGLRFFLDDIISAIVHDTGNLTDIYKQYVREVLDVKDIKRWSSKKTITQKVLENTRTNEVQVRNAIAGSEYREGDKVWLFFKQDNTLCLAENFDGDYNKEKLLKKLFMTTKIFENVLPVKDLFINYSLKKNKKLLENL